jgi:hypothetical protein
MYKYMNHCAAHFRLLASDGVSSHNIAFSMWVLPAHGKQRIIVEAESSNFNGSW